MKEIIKSEYISKYTSPLCRVVKFNAERGFELSGNGSVGWEDGSADGGNVNDLGNF